MHGKQCKSQILISKGFFTLDSISTVGTLTHWHKLGRISIKTYGPKSLLQEPRFRSNSTCRSYHIDITMYIFEIKVYLDYEFKFLSQTSIKDDTFRQDLLARIKCIHFNQYKLSQAIETPELPKNLRIRDGQSVWKLSFPCVVVDSWRPLTSRHVFCHLRGAPRGQSPFRQQVQHACKLNIGLKRKSRVLSRAHITPAPLIRSLNSIGVVQFPGDYGHRCKNHLQNYSKLRHEDPLKSVAPALITAGRHNPHKSWIQSCCKIIPTFKMLKPSYINAGCYG